MKVKLQNCFIAACLFLMCFSLPFNTFAASDTVKPLILGATKKTVYIGSSFNALSGVTAKDNVDGNITKYINVSGTVNIKRTGNYKLIYSVTDKAKNKATVTRTITVKKDTVKPTISGATKKTVYIGSSFNALSGVKAKDNVDGNITKYIKVSGTINIKKTGNYTLTYSVTDKAKNKTTVTRTITIKKDTSKPTISGASNKTVYIGSSFNALSGVTAKDNVDGNITKNIKVSGSVNTKKTGKYNLTYYVSDNAKNTTTVIRTITILDNVKPKISGVQNIELNFGDDFNALAGISASDNNDGDITSSIKVNGSVNVNKAGSYVLTYSVSDQSGNSISVQRTVTVIDTIKPILSGAQDIQVNFGDNFNALDGISASDNSDGDITSAIKVDGSVNVNKAGSYVLTYSVSDQSGNSVSVNRVITVIDNISPIISGATDSTIGLYTQFNLLDGISAFDNNDGDLTSIIETSGSIDTNMEGKFIVTYKVSDAAGNTTVINRTITVQKIAVTGVLITAPTTMKTEMSQQLAVVISPIDATNQNIIWHSSDESLATIDEHGVLKTLSEGTLTITATVDGVSTSKTITISDRPNLYLYKSGSVIINNLIKSLSFNIYNLEPDESVYIEKVEIYENNSLYSTYNAETLSNAGISTTITPYNNWGMSINFKIGIWANQSKIVVTVRTENGKSYQYSINV